MEFLANSSTFYHIITDLEGRYAYANNYFLEKFGFVEEEIMGTNFSNSVHPDDVERCNQVAYEIITHPEKIIPIDIRKPNKQGGFFWTAWEFSMAKDGSGNPVGIRCIGFDITAAQKARKDLEAYTERIKKLMTIEEQKKANVKNVLATLPEEIKDSLIGIFGLIQVFNFEDYQDDFNKIVIERLAEYSEVLDKLIFE
ncbi:MAG: PAS domain-containing protein [Cytophagales bacterium]|nr:PAS domain-containing protein [Bernardetiaceae bacterium]MDW8203873.1 PAS domain-containing protein [Cytophagales bacterium]